MFADIAISFQNITKFDLRQYFIDYRDFLTNDFPDVSNYYAGKTETIDAAKIKRLKDLITRSRNLLQQFSTFDTKFSNVGFWELQQYCQDLNETLERITKLPKYNRVSKSPRGYKPYIQASYSVGGMRTMEDVAREIGETTTESELILNNDLEEENYDIDKLSNINALVNNTSGVVVDTILETPVGNRVYGRDIQRKIEIEGNDLKIVEWEDNVEQKVEILLMLEQGDIPEMPNLGRAVIEGSNYRDYNYTELLTDLRNVFYQDDLFAYVGITDVSYKDGDISVNVEVNTKYIYSTTKTITL
jgi:hypothetical protein